MEVKGGRGDDGRCFKVGTKAASNASKSHGCTKDLPVV